MGATAQYWKGTKTERCPNGCYDGGDGCVPCSGECQNCSTQITGGYYGPDGKRVKALRYGQYASRNFMDMSTLTQPSTIIPVGIAAIAGGLAGNWASKKVVLPFIGKKYPKANKWIMIIGGALVLACVAKWGADKYLAPSASTTETPEEGGSQSGAPKSVELTVE